MALAVTPGLGLPVLVGWDLVTDDTPGPGETGAVAAGTSPPGRGTHPDRAR